MLIDAEPEVMTDRVAHTKQYIATCMTYPLKYNYAQWAQYSSFRFM